MLPCPPRADPSGEPFPPSDSSSHPLAGRPPPHEISVQNLAGQRPPSQIAARDLAGQRPPSEILCRALIGPPPPSEIGTRNLSGQPSPHEISQEDLAGRSPPSEISRRGIDGRLRPSESARRGDDYENVTTTVTSALTGIDARAAGLTATGSSACRRLRRETPPRQGRRERSRGRGSSYKDRRNPREGGDIVAGRAGSERLDLRPVTP